MLERSMPLANGERMPDRAGDILLRAARRSRQAAALRQERGHRRGERAAGPVGVLRVDARRPKLEELVAVEEQVDDLLARCVSPLDDHRARAKTMDAHRRLAR